MMRVLSALLLALAVNALAQTPPPESGNATLELTAKLGTGVENRELVGEAAQFQAGDKAYLWMRLAGGPTDPVTVTWSIDEHTYDVQLEVGGPSWRTWSSKTLWMAGDWSVEVRDARGTSLFTSTFTVRAATSKMVEDTVEGSGSEPR